MNEDKITIKLEDGTIVDGTILFTFEANGDNFVLYEYKEDVLAAKMDLEGSLSPIEEDEWSIVEKAYEEFQEEMDEEEMDEEEMDEEEMDEE